MLLLCFLWACVPYRVHCAQMVIHQAQLGALLVGEGSIFISTAWRHQYLGGDTGGLAECKAPSKHSAPWHVYLLNLSSGLPPRHYKGDLSKKKLDYVTFRFNLEVVLYHLKDRAQVPSTWFKAGPSWPALPFFSNTFYRPSGGHAYLCTQTPSGTTVPISPMPCICCLHPRYPIPTPTW